MNFHSIANDRVDSIIEELISRPFDLSTDYMLRADLVQVAAEDFILVTVLHHIASDGWSTGILVRELTELYNSYLEGRSSELKPLSIQYADYAIWQRKYLAAALLDNKLEYWRNQLQGVEALELPTDYSRPAIQSTRGAVVRFSISEQETAAFRKLCEAEGVTMFMGLLSVFKILLYRYSGQRDICVGTPIANRTHHEMEGLIGFFVNTIALRTSVDPVSGFREFLQQVRQTTLSAYDHQDVPFEKVVDAIVRERDMSRSPIFQVMFDMQTAGSGLFSIRNSRNVGMYRRVLR
jgi:hypothetical protein